MTTFISPEQFGNAFIPQRIRPYIRKYVEKAGKTEVPYRMFGIIFYIILILTLIIFVAFINPFLQADKLKLFGYDFVIGAVSRFIMTFLSWVVVPLILALIAMICIWVYYELVIYRRTKEIEDILPDFLQAVSVNLKAGMIFDKALWNAVSPDYEVLAKEIEIVAKKSMTGRDLETALQEFSEKYKSNVVKESMELIVIGLKSGGSITDLLDRLISNIRHTTNLKNELVAAVSGNIFFITLIAVVVAPVLFALSFNLLTIIQSLGSRMSSTGGIGFLGGFSFGTEAVKGEDFIIFSRAAVFVIALFSSMLIANIKSGNIKGGFKYLPIFVICAFIVYQLALTGFTLMFYL